MKKYFTICVLLFFSFSAHMHAGIYYLEENYKRSIARCDVSIWIGDNNDLNEFDYKRCSTPLIIVPDDTTITDSCQAYFEFYTDASAVVHFTNLSVGSDSVPIVSYYWDFCDGSTATTENPLHYFAVGDICACLTIVDSLGCTDTYCFYSVDIPNKDSFLKIFPNPSTNNQIHLISTSQINIVNILDLTGREIPFTFEQINAGEWTITLKEKHDGILFIRYTINGREYTEKMLFLMTN